MQRKDIKVRSSTGGGEFDCYLVTPDGSGKVPAMVLASAVHGVDQDIRAIADEFASHGYLVAAPDLFWRTVPGPLGRDDDRTKTRSQPRLEVIKKGEADMADTLAELKKLPQFNGRAATMGFCYGGPYAILGPSVSVTQPASPAMARRCWITSRNWTASRHPSASSGATRTTRRRLPCRKPIAPYPHG
jgi:dienelactone hydrolase